MGGEHRKVMGGQQTFFCGVLFALGYVGLNFVQSAEGRSSHSEDISETYVSKLFL